MTNQSAEGDDGRVSTRQPTTVHLINHTHWDREWFLTHEYTTAWIPSLIDSLVELAEANKDYEYLFDGQTLVMEDLFTIAPAYRERVERLVSGGTLRIGPLYSQPDWRLVSGELHLRNLIHGTGDAAALGGSADVAWLVDTFGHISQAPQLLSMVGVDAAFVWRGVPEMHPVFDWVGSDGTRLVTVDLFGGYRNLYGITRTEDIAVDRLVAETNKLAPHYGDVPIPLFDGYDLDCEPEDPVRYYRDQTGVPDGISLVASSPRAYIDAAVGASNGSVKPEIRGELLSGRYGATFPGSLSTRSYLKVLQHDAEVALHRRAEPLAVFAAAIGQDYPAALFERADRDLLQNAVHDCICGVSIDQVHERMDRSYRTVIDSLNDSSTASIEAFMGGFRPGRYAVSTAAMSGRIRQRVGARLVTSNGDGLGVSPIESEEPVETVERTESEFIWTNDHFEARVDGDGVLVDGRPAFQPVIRAERGDTYSSEPGEILGLAVPSGPPVVESTSAVDAVVRLETRWQRDDGIDVRATMRLRFDDGPVIEATIDLDSDGTGFRLDLETETGVETDRVLAGMPFDLVERPHVDLHLEPTELSAELAAVLMGQREVEQVDEFPFHDVVALGDSTRTCAMLARGVRSYRSIGGGRIGIALRRSVEWLALSNLPHRAGDAGPAMYVPGARDERSIRHEVALAVLPGDVDGVELFRIAESFVNPPLIVDVDGEPSDGPDRWVLPGEALPTSALHLADGAPVLRVFNPSDESRKLTIRRDLRTARGEYADSAEQIGPRKVVTMAVAVEPPTGVGPLSSANRVTVHGLPDDRVGPSRSRPTEAVMAEMAARRAELLRELEPVEADLPGSTGSERHRLTHRRYVLAREASEIELSLELNRRLAESTAVVSIPDDVDPDIARLGHELNELRIRRRIYDYVVASL